MSVEIASLDIAVNSSSVPVANSSLQGLTSTAKETEAATAALTVRQDRFLQSLDRQAATMGQSAAAMRLYKAEQLGLSNDKIFANLNKQISDLETSGPSAMDKIATRMEGRVGTMALRMGVHFALVTVAIGMVSSIYHGLTDAAEAARENQNNLWTGIYDAIVKAENKLNDYKAGLPGLSDAEQKGLSALNWRKTVAEANLNNALVAQKSLPQTFDTGEGFSVDVNQEGAAREAAALVDLRKKELDEINTNLDFVDSQRKAAKAIDDTTQALKDAEAGRIKYRNTLLAMNQGLTLEQLTLEQGERAAYAYSLSIAGIRDADAKALMVKWDYNKALKDQAQNEEWLARLSHDIRSGDRQRTNNAYKGDQADLKQQADDWSMMVKAAYPWISEAQQIAQQQTMLNTFFDLGGIELDAYSKRYLDLEVAMLKVKAGAGDTWAIIGYTVTQNGAKATDAMVSWMDNLDGLGHSWKTLGDTVESVLRDMILQMQKAILQQQLMDPFMKWAGLAIGSLGTGAASSGGYTGAFSSGGLDYPALGGVANAGSSVQSSIVVNVNGSTGETSSTSKATGATDLSRQIEDAVNAVIIKNQRQGGLLSAGA